LAFYESVFIARQDVSAAQVEALTETFTNIVETQGGKVLKKESWGLRNLTYRVKKNRKGHYTLLNLDAPAAAVNEMERNMQINEDVIRFLTVRVEELEAGPSAVIQNKGREDRDDRRGGRFGDDRPRFRDDDRSRFGGGGRRRHEEPDAPAATPAATPAEGGGQ
jgi:small subunit ribosomal protein S6